MMGWFGDLVSDFGAGISEAGSNAVDYFTKNHPTVYHRTERKKYIRDQMYEQDTHKTVRVYQSYH